MKDVFVVGIAGGSGSGKSTFAKKLHNYFKEQSVILCSDNYYHPHHNMSMEERNKINYDSPEAIDLSLLAKHILTLKNKGEIDCPVYDFAQHNRTSETIKIKPKPIIITDGILIFHQKELRDAFDLKVFVDADADERILRRIKRDTGERGRTVENVTEQYLKTVKPMHEIYVEPTKKLADIIINGGKNNEAFELVKSRLKIFLEETER